MYNKYLSNAVESKYNVAHVPSMKELEPTQVKKYVERCIRVAANDLARYDDELWGNGETKRQCAKLIMSTLKWMDVSKCGSHEDRERWRKEHPGICLDIHNEASAKIYMHESDDDDWTKYLVYVLISTHGLIGQYLMGEINLSASKALANLPFNPLARVRMLMVLNHAIIEGVSYELWENVKRDVAHTINRIFAGDFKEYDTLERLKRLFPAYHSVDSITDEEETVFGTIFSRVSLWYPTVALRGFTRRELLTIFKGILDYGLIGLNHINFYDFSVEMSYDLNGKKKENVYKKRILETLLREKEEYESDVCGDEHVSIVYEVDEDCMCFKIKFTPVCNALINFCVEAERSGFASYQKNIITIFDMFGFRRDIFDRLSNEEAYLETMNNAKTSTKMSILDFVSGSTVVDVGSGGGVLLDEMEKRFPHKQLIGTDISINVIEALHKKIQEERHRYCVMKHNFVDGPLPVMPTPVDNIIFSSIMHEIYSYTEFGGRKFNIAAVHEALKNAKRSLINGGRIIIRDGVKTDSNRIVSVRIKDEDSLTLAKNYLKDFAGLPELRDEFGNWRGLSVNQDIITGDINLIREMLYTITWGAMSYAQEVQEQFGYFTLDEYQKVLESIGMRVIKATQFIEPGYPEHLDDKVDLIDFTWEDIPSNCIIVARKLSDMITHSIHTRY